MQYVKNVLSEEIEKLRKKRERHLNEMETYEDLKQNSELKLNETNDKINKLLQTINDL